MCQGAGVYGRTSRRRIVGWYTLWVLGRQSAGLSGKHRGLFLRMRAWARVNEEDVLMVLMAMTRFYRGGQAEQDLRVDGTFRAQRASLLPFQGAMVSEMRRNFAQ